MFALPPQRIKICNICRKYKSPQIVLTSIYIDNLQTDRLYKYIYSECYSIRVVSNIVQIVPV